jgi:hypothetical protein
MGEREGLDKGGAGVGILIDGVGTWQERDRNMGAGCLGGSKEAPRFL